MLKESKFFWPCEVSPLQRLGFFVDVPLKTDFTEEMLILVTLSLLSALTFLYHPVYSSIKRFVRTSLIRKKRWSISGIM